MLSNGTALLAEKAVSLIEDICHVLQRCQKGVITGQQSAMSAYSLFSLHEASVHGLSLAKEQTAMNV